MAGTGIYGELLKAQLENLSSDPGSTSVGRLYWNTTTQSARIYTSSGWDDLGGGGSGASGRNYLADWFDGDRDPGTPTNSITATGNITISTTAWQASDTLKLTVARTSSSPLRQTYSILLDHVATGAAFVQTPCFLLDAADLGKPVTVSFDVANVVTSDDYQVYAVRYTSGGTYQEQIPIIGTASATSPYSARIPTGTTKFQGFFIAGSTSTDYYVIRFYRNSASDTTDIKVDSLYAGPEKVVQGAGISDWVAFTPSGSNLPSFTTNVGWYRRVGDSMEIAVKWLVSGAGAAATSSINIPNSNTADTSKTNIVGNGSSLGSGYWYDASGTDSIPVSITTDGSSIYIVGQNAGNADTLDGNDFAASDQVSFTATIPIVGWSSNVTMLDTANSEFVSNSSSTNTTDTTSFAYGAAGSLGLSSTPAGSSIYKVVRCQKPILPTTKFILEVSVDRTTWVEPGTYTGAMWMEKLRHDGTNAIGIGYRVDASSATDVQIVFGKYASGSTTAWTGTWYWRLRVVHGDSLAGTPIGARNIVGDTTGTAVPSGYIGEVITATITATSATTSEADVTGATLALTPGVWDIRYSLSGYAQTGASTSNATYMITCITDSANTHIGNTERIIGAKTVAAVSNYVESCSAATTIVSISANTTYKLRLKRTDSAGTGSGGVYASAGNYNSTFFAVRIA